METQKWLQIGVGSTTAHGCDGIGSQRLGLGLIDIGIKYFTDGTPLSKTALLVEPYADDPSTRGEMTIGERQFDRIKQAHRDGIQVHMHSTADGTTRTLLDVIEEARAEDCRGRRTCRLRP